MKKIPSIDFDYKIFNLEHYLSNDEFNKLNSLITDFDVDVYDIKSALGFLQWSDRVQKTLKESDFDRYEKINNSYSIDYNDYRYLNYLNSQNNFNDEDYFNFLLVEKHGWYSPTNKNNNLSGVSRDHMFSVREGFEKGIDRDTEPVLSMRPLD
jgi:hypothetical protein